ncbi:MULTISPECIES: DUF2946 family protein [Pseudomonas]|uniref:DUF2946 family protein n=1 Tax=Pseudomonas TaxID=286 RepID=UPI00257EEDE5|nr:MULTISPECIES: DUF2946 family protein [Pseudomonas]
MTFSRRHSASLLGALLFSVLLGAFASSLHRGQMSGFDLAGVGGGFCSALGNSGAALKEGGDRSTPLLADLQCPLCSAGDSPSASGSLWRLFAPAAVDVTSSAIPPRTPAAPRDVWPSANPRASPLFLG